MDTEMSLARQAIKNLELLRAQRDQWDFDSNQAVCDEIDFKDDVDAEIEPANEIDIALQSLFSEARFERESAIRRSAISHWKDPLIEKELLSQSFNTFESCAFATKPGIQKMDEKVFSDDLKQPCIESNHSKSKKEIQNYITRHHDSQK